MIENVNKERAIRAVIRQAIEAYASGFSDRHLSEVDDEEGTINMKIHNVFIAALGADIQYYSALARSLDSSLGNMLEKMAINIASLNYEVSQHVEGPIYQEQTDYIAELLERYKNTKGINHKKPEVSDYIGISSKKSTSRHSKRHESDYYLKDIETGMHYLIELKIGGDLDNKKARSEKEALLEQYCILANALGSEKILRFVLQPPIIDMAKESHGHRGVYVNFLLMRNCLLVANFGTLCVSRSEGMKLCLMNIRKMHILLSNLWHELRMLIFLMSDERPKLA